MIRRGRGQGTGAYIQLERKVRQQASSRDRREGNRTEKRTDQTRNDANEQTTAAIQHNIVRTTAPETREEKRENHPTT